MKSKQNLHLEHLEDEIINLGSKGATRAFAFIDALLKTFEGKTTSKVDLTVKWDGAPAIVAGQDPLSGLFFVATKHAAFGATPRLAYTEDMIDMLYEGKGSLIDTLKAAYRELRPLGLSQVIQGDILFTKDTLKQQMIDGELHYTFKPNTIMYAVPVNSDTGKVLASANIGIVFHTLYNGTDAVNKMTASFGVDVSGLSTPTAWIQNASYKDISGKLAMTQLEYSSIADKITAAKRNANTAKSFLDKIAGNTDPLSIAYLFKLFVNREVREGRAITQQSIPRFRSFVVLRFNEKVSSVKTTAAKDRYKGLQAEITKFMSANSTSLSAVFALYRDLVSIKGLMIKKLNEAQGIATFLDTPDGFVVTFPEGYVAIDKKGNSVKLVDRLEFSRANFTAVKDWKQPAVAKPKTMVFTFGRMNPPTAGHQKVIDKVVNLAKAEGGDHLIVMSHSQDVKKNPLSPSEKVEFARKLFPGINMDVSSPRKPTFFKFLEEFAAQGYERVIFVVGSDRVPNVTRDTAMYNGKDYTFKQLDVVSAGVRDPDAEGVTGISASKMREYALQNDLVKFKQGLPATASKSLAEALMNAVRRGMKLE